jgi:hypothetical protein
MIIIKIPIEVTTYKMEAILHGLKTYMVSGFDAFSNGKTAGDRYDTMVYQVALKLTDKLIRKLYDKKLQPTKKETFKIKLPYHEALILLNVLQDTAIGNTDLQIAINQVIEQLDKQL